MAKPKRVVPLSTQEKISDAEKGLMILNQQKAEIEIKIREKKQELAALGKQLEGERLNEIADIASRAGITVMDILSAFKDGDILSLIPAGKNQYEKIVPRQATSNSSGNNILPQTPAT